VQRSKNAGLFASGFRTLRYSLAPLFGRSFSRYWPLFSCRSQTHDIVPPCIRELCLEKRRLSASPICPDVVLFTRLKPMPKDAAFSDGSTYRGHFFKARRSRGSRCMTPRRTGPWGHRRGGRPRLVGTAPMRVFAKGARLPVSACGRPGVCRRG
jgi:hypothetical protein